jgi:hypothetical protein
MQFLSRLRVICLLQPFASSLQRTATTYAAVKLLIAFKKLQTWAIPNILLANAG